MRLGTILWHVPGVQYVVAIAASTFVSFSSVYPLHMHVCIMSGLVVRPEIDRRLGVVVPPHGFRRDVGGSQGKENPCECGRRGPDL